MENIQKENEAMEENVKSGRRGMNKKIGSLRNPKSMLTLEDTQKVDQTVGNN
jgi:hypothetical protein